jgi:hypothetical protein
VRLQAALLYYAFSLFFDLLGTFKWPNGDKYEGEFVKDQCHGVGIHTYADNKQYKGEWLDNKKHGYGVLIYPKGEKTEGSFLWSF